VLSRRPLSRGVLDDMPILSPRLRCLRADADLSSFGLGEYDVPDCFDENAPLEESVSASEVRGRRCLAVMGVLNTAREPAVDGELPAVGEVLFEEGFAAEDGEGC
jgi:hypothetical protein